MPPLPNWISLTLPYQGPPALINLGTARYLHASDGHPQITCVQEAGLVIYDGLLAIDTLRNLCVTLGGHIYGESPPGPASWFLYRSNLYSVTTLYNLKLLPRLYREGDGFVSVMTPWGPIDTGLTPAEADALIGMISTCTGAVPL